MAFFPIMYLIELREVSLLYFLNRANYPSAISCVHVLSFAPSYEMSSVLPLVCAQGLIP